MTKGKLFILTVTAILGLIILQSPHSSAPAAAIPTNALAVNPAAANPTNALAANPTNQTQSNAAQSTSTSTIQSHQVNANLQLQAAELKKSFAATHAQVQGYVLNSWTQINRQFQPISAIRQMSARIEQELHILNAKTLIREGTSENYVEVYGQWPGHIDVSATLSSFRFSTGPDMTVLVLQSDNETGSLNGFANGFQQIGETVANLGFMPQISACIQGFTSARMVDGQQNQVISDALSAVHAARVEGLITGRVQSISAYTQRIPDYIYTHSHKMNLQVATHYDPYHHRTNVLVGTPIITITY